VTGCLLLAVLVLLVNVGFVVCAATCEKQQGSASAYQGSCKTTASLLLGSHVGINVLRSALLSASSYCMQILSAPTRTEIDEAHFKHVWVDIGLQSIRNLRRISPRRVMMWWLHVLSSVPLHLIYNSAAFSMLSAYEYKLLVVTRNFLLPKPWKNTVDTINPEVLKIHDRLQGSHQGFDNLPAGECFQYYSRSFSPRRKDVIAVLKNKTTTDLPPTENRTHLSIAPDYQVSTPSNSITMEAPFNHTDILSGYILDYCLSDAKTRECQFLIVVPILIIVIICNLCKALVMYKLYHDRNR